MDFKERLKEFRKELGYESKRDFSKELGVSENVYYMVENGIRNPSKKFLEKLVCLSSKPTEFWLYGVEEQKEYLIARERYKMLKCLLEEFKEDFKENNEFTEIQQKMILIAAKADLIDIIGKEKEGMF